MLLILIFFNTINLYHNVLHFAKCVMRISHPLHSKLPPPIPSLVTLWATHILLHVSIVTVVTATTTCNIHSLLHRHRRFHTCNIYCYTISVTLLLLPVTFVVTTSPSSPHQKEISNSTTTTAATYFHHHQCHH